MAGVLTAWVAAAPSAAAEVPVPRLSPEAGVAQARFVAHAPAAMGPKVSLSRAIEREVAVDVSRAVSALYARRDYRPLWDAERETALRARLAEAAGDGLDPADYAVPQDDGDVFSRAAEDVSLTEAALRYARHAHSGRIDPRTVSRLVDRDPPELNVERFLNRLAIAGNVVATLESAHPVHPQYHALREALRDALDRDHVDIPAVGKGPNLRVGSRGARVAILRSRLETTVRRGEDPQVFDTALDRAVREFQRENDLLVDGIVGPRTLAVLDKDVDDDPVATLAANLERWRWMPRHLGRRHVIVNIPAFRVEVQHAGDRAYEGRVIVGRPAHPTPSFSDEIEHVVVNPYWNVPYSIASSEMLGPLSRNPSGYAARRNLEVVVGGRVVHPSSVQWNRDTLRRVRIRQRPGRGNALGTVKFLFPNEWAVYLHDTPTRHLFRRASRAYSHGCVRVQNPFDFAEALLAGEEAVSGRKLERMAGGNRRWFNVQRTIPVHLAYFTREVNADGELVRHADIYGWDRRTRQALAPSS
jgi:murein L,D-transpeptidase YcbB/YkuD